MRRRFYVEGQLLVSNKIIIDQSITNPLQRVSGDINGPIIQWIRENSHRYLCKYSQSAGHMVICQLDDNNSNFYFDGQASVLTGVEGDVMMRLPVFYTKFTDISGGLSKVSIEFSLYQQDDSWVKWGGDDFIGVYEANYSNSLLRSISGVESSGSISQANFYNYARMREANRIMGPGYGFTLVKQRHQNIMGILYVAMYGNTNCQETIGYGTGTYTKPTGQTDALGMTDTQKGTNGNTMSINFWGLENWWGNKYEWVDNVLVNPESVNSVFRITEDNGITRDVQSMSTRGSWVYPHKMVLGDNLDLIAAPGESGGASNVGWSDGQYIGSSTTRVVLRSYFYADDIGGVACSDAYIASSYSHANIGSRLAFKGAYSEAGSVSEFKDI